MTAPPGEAGLRAELAEACATYGPAVELGTGHVAGELPSSGRQLQREVVCGLFGMLEKAL